jgi:oligopeptide transport system substrate-binding protein
MLSHNTWWPVHRPTILKHGKSTDRISKWTKPKNFVGNGPFTLKHWRLNNGIYAIQNPYYRDLKAVSLNGIHFLPIAVQSEERAFRAGHLHLTSSVPIHRIEWYRKHQPERLRFDTALGVYYYMLNTEKGPLADPLVRQALAYSINREELTEFILKQDKSLLLISLRLKLEATTRALDCPTTPNLHVLVLQTQAFREAKVFQR